MVPAFFPAVWAGVSDRRIRNMAGDILNERAAKTNVQSLAAGTDAEYRHFAAHDHLLDKAHIKVVSCRGCQFYLIGRVFLVMLRIVVVAAYQHQSVDAP